jgi:hypothetical protein
MDIVWVNTTENTEPIQELKYFYPSQTFTGELNGYIFTTGINGTGYYKDTNNVVKN